MEFINSESISVKIWHQMFLDAIFTVVFGSRAWCKPVLPTSAAANYRRGSENENIVNIGENIGKYRKMSQGGKKYKNIHFFSIF